MKYEKWLNEWLENYVEPTAKSRTIRRYSEIVSQHVLPSLGKYELKELNPPLIQCFITKLLKNGNLKTGEGLAVNSVNAIISVVQNSLKAAYDVGYIESYTANRIKRPKRCEREINCFTPNEQKRIEKEITCGDNKLFGVILCLYSGLRIGELLALKWEDIDFKSGILTVCRSCYDGKDKDGKYKRIEETPKTISSKREIPLPRQLLPIIRRNKKNSDSAYVVSGLKDSVSVRSYQRSFDLLQKKLNIPHRGFHSLRHTFATRALECGMDVKTLSEILGHKSPSVTLNRYVHSLIDHKRAMMNRLGKLL